MKRSFFAAVVIFCVMPFVSSMEIVKARTMQSCTWPTIVRKFEGGTNPYGINVETAKKTGPTNPVVVGQDDEKRGVDIRVRIRSYAGIVDYERPVLVKTDEQWYYYPQKGMQCEKELLGGYYCWNTRVECVPDTIKVYRDIDISSIKVWLDPDPETLLWLGSVANAKERKWPLRYMYPDKWALGYWEPNDTVRTEQDPRLDTDWRIKRFIDKYPDYEFIKADPRGSDLPSSDMEIIADPMGSGHSVIALFGDFGLSNPKNQTKVSNPLCRIGMGKGACVTTPQYWDPQQRFIYDFTINLNNVPLDLPGNWYVGVEFMGRPAEATINGMPWFEKIPPEEKMNLKVFPGHGYIMKVDESDDTHKFTSYAIISTICNDLEPYGCER